MKKSSDALSWARPNKSLRTIKLPLLSPITRWDPQIAPAIVFLCVVLHVVVSLGQLSPGPVDLHGDMFLSSTLA